MCTVPTGRRRPQRHEPRGHPSRSPEFGQGQPLLEYLTQAGSPALDDQQQQQQLEPPAVLFPVRREGPLFCGHRERLILPTRSEMRLQPFSQTEYTSDLVCSGFGGSLGFFSGLLLPLPLSRFQFQKISQDMCANAQIIQLLGVEDVVRLEVLDL